jgi:hypothetical protein
MPGLRRYVEWMNRGRRTDRVVYLFKEWDLPKPLPGAEWQLDAKFNLADARLREPELKTVLKAALETAPRLSSRSSDGTSDASRARAERRTVDDGALGYRGPLCGDYARAN